MGFGAAWPEPLVCAQSLHRHCFPWLERKVAAHLVATQLEGDSDINGLVDHADDRAHQGHEEQWEPDNTHEEQDDEATHAILNNLLLLLPLGLWVFLVGGCMGHSLSSAFLLPCLVQASIPVPWLQALFQSSPCCSRSRPPCPCPSCPQGYGLGLSQWPHKVKF